MAGRGRFSGVYSDLTRIIMVKAGKAKIAIINCEKEDANLLFSSLFDSGYSVVISAKGSSGLDIITREKPDLIILDILAENMSGLALLDILQARSINIPILVITVPELVSDNLAQRGIAGLLIKPIDKERMLTHVEAILDLQEISRVYSERERPGEERAAPAARRKAAQPPPQQQPVPQAPPAQQPTQPETAETTEPEVEVQAPQEEQQPQPQPQQPPLKAVPAQPTPIRAGLKPSAEESGPAKKPLVLVVDDEPDMRTLLSDLLSFSGFEVMTADDGVQGLKTAQQVMPQAMLLDIMLPKLDGFQVCRLLKFNEKYAEIPIIMLTARNHPKDRELAEGSGADGYIIKPFETKALIEAIKKVIGAKAQYGSGAS